MQSSTNSQLPSWPPHPHPYFQAGNKQKTHRLVIDGHCFPRSFHAALP
jgi:hypothetical protein